MPRIAIRVFVASGCDFRRHARGYTYLALLFVVAFMGVALAAVGTLWHTAQMRDKERELLYVGDQYRKAIQLYYNAPAPVKQFPRELAQLLKDPRQPALRRYLRKLYRDPITGTSEWGLIKAPDGGIAGVYSLSEAAPFKTADFSKAYAEFEGKTKYSEWKFAYTGGVPAGSTAAPAQASPATGSPSPTSSTGSPSPTSQSTSPFATPPPKTKPVP